MHFFREGGGGAPTFAPRVGGTPKIAVERKIEQGFQSGDSIYICIFNVETESFVEGVTTSLNLIKTCKLLTIFTKRFLNVLEDIKSQFLNVVFNV